MSQIAGTVNHTVTITRDTRAVYGSPLTVAATGHVTGGTGAVGVNGVSGASDLSLINHGTVAGGTGSFTISGGAGVELSNATVYNNGYFYGGTGGITGGAGGTGVDLSDCTLTNKVGIYGGNVLSGNGSGGAGAYLSGGSTMSYGFIVGGDSTYGVGGDGVDLAASAQFLDVGASGNDAPITGGHGGSVGGTGVSLTSGAQLTNGGVPTIGGPDGYQTRITGGTGTVAGGAGVSASGSYTYVVNHYAINGGGGGATGGAGVVVSAGADLTNGSGASVYGGADSNAGGTGGAGVDVGAGSYLSNSGEIVGGQCGINGNSGIGVILETNALCLNADGGIIAGGFGGTGGVGVEVGAGAVLINQHGGTITGTSAMAGVYLNGGTFNDAGAIGGIATNATGDAVDFSPTAQSFMLVGYGATFQGEIGGFAIGDKVDFADLAPADAIADFNPFTDTMTTAGDGTLDFKGTFSGESMVLSSDGSGGTDISLVAGLGLFTTASTTITLGTKAFPSALTITNIGGVAPTAAGATGVVSKLAANNLTNNGAIQGGTGTAGNTGGVGGFGVNFNAGTLTNTGSISGGVGGAGNAKGGRGGAGVLLNGGKLTTSGTISGGLGGAGGVNGLGGVAVQFGTVASTLVVESGAVFNGAIGGFGTSDTIDIEDLTPSEVSADFNPTTHVLTTASDGTLHFNGSFSGEYFAFSSDGSAGSDVTLEQGSGISTTLTSTVTLGGTAHPSPLTITATGVVAPTNVGAAGVHNNTVGNVLTNNGTIQGGAGSSSTVGGSGGIGANFKLSGTLTNTGSIAGGAGGVGSMTGGHGGAGVFWNGGTLENAGTISGGKGGTGTTSGAAGDAVQFGSAASTLMVDPGAVFNGHVVANASVNDVLELSGTEAGSTAIKLGTEFTNFSTLTFLPGAAWTVDAGTHAAPSSGLAINGFTTGDTIDITNLTPTQVAADFNNDVLTTASDGTLTFSGVSGDTFVFMAKGAGTDVTVQPSPAATLAASGHDLTNFVGDEHRALMGGQFMLDANGFGSGSMLHTDPALETLGDHGFSANAMTDHGIAHALSVGSHA
jgi:hypothetical protein